MMSPAKIKKYTQRVGRTLRDNAVEIGGLMCFFLVAPLMFLFVYSRLPTLVMVAALSTFLWGLFPLCSGLSLFAGSLTVGVLISTAAGLHLYHGLLVPAMSLQYGRSYSGVYASQAAVAYPDAALLRFAANASVDSSKALGLTTLEGGLSTLCIAPIVDGQSTGRAEFWAIGLDCCGKLSNFACDQADELGVHGGYVIEDSRDVDVWYAIIGKYFAPTLYRRDLFLQAVRLAENVHGVVSTDKPIMLRWSSQTRSGLVVSRWLRLVVFVFALVSCAFVGGIILAPMAHELRGKIAAQAIMKREPEEEQEHEPIDFQHNVVQGFVFPFIAFALCVLLASWSHCFVLGGVLAAATQSALVAIALALLACRWSFRHGILLLLSGAIATYVGHLNFVNNTFPYCSVQARRTYANITADVDPLTLQDAGKIHFSSASTIGVQQSLGFRYRGTNYCVAPILPEGCAAGSGAPAAAPAPAPTAAGAAGAGCTANFWAVGLDCCDARGGFSCGWPGREAVGNAPHSAVLHDVMEHGIHDESRRNYMRAVQSASSLHNFLLPEKPMLVRVASQSDDVDRLVQEWRGLALGVSLLAVALSFLVLTGIAFAELNLQQRRYQIPLVFGGNR